MKRLTLITLFIATLLISACGGGSTPPPAAPEFNSVPKAWIDSPLDGTSFPLGEIEIISHSQDLTGIARVELSANNEVIRTDENPNPSLTLFVIGQKWTPAQPGDYLVQVRGQTTAGAWSEYTAVNIKVIGEIATPTSLPTVTPVPSSTPTPTPPGPLTFTFTKNAFCRKGPDVSFPDVTGITAGETVDILHISTDSFWYLVYWKAFNVQCWVAAATGEVNGDLTGVEVLAGPNTPVPSSTFAPRPTIVPTATDRKP